jgi:pimeloyl-ACP methyl ester carboxylesterase
MTQKLRSWYVVFFQLPIVPELGFTARGGQAVERALTATSPNFPPDRLAVYRANACRPGAATAMVNYYRANALALGVGALTTAKIWTPTLLIWGENDPYLDLALTEGNEAYVEDFTLRRLPGVSHWVQEDASLKVNRLIAEWAKAKGLV